MTGGSRSGISVCESEASQTVVPVSPPRQFHDAFPQLPRQGSQHVLSKIIAHLDPTDLIRFCLLNTAWLTACATNAELWANICLKDGVAMGPEAIPEMETLLQEGPDSHIFPLTCLWKEVWVNAQIVKRNWEVGRCGIGHVRVADIRDAVTCFHFDSDKILIGTRRHKLTLFPSLHPCTPTTTSTPASFKQTPFLPEHESALICMHFNPQETSIAHIMAVGDASGAISVWNLFTGKRIAWLEDAHESGVTTVLVVEKSKFGGVASLAGGGRSEIGEGGEEGLGVVVVSSGFDFEVKAHWLRLDPEEIVVAKPTAGRSTITSSLKHFRGSWFFSIMLV
ncbi:hypothetical protein HDU98_005413 [Podochytrium sp. JEL0797]|nr:hypothetical protein HDU98_005413 [Podochytrium sp. JEL0797]